MAKRITKEDIIATATAFTAVTIADAYRRFFAENAPRGYPLAAAGPQNKTLVKLLQRELSKSKILTTGDFGINPDAKEAVSFAILAWAAIKKNPG